MRPGDRLAVRKLRHDGTFVTTWEGELREQDSEHLMLQAGWQRDKPMFLGYTVFEQGDVFIETYYPNKWYSVWQVCSWRNGRTKGWYCNICAPYQLTGNELQFRDLELDVFLYPDGRYVVLDEDDLAGAPVSDEDRAGAHAGLAEVISSIGARRGPFQHIGPPRRVAPFW